MVLHAGHTSCKSPIFPLRLPCLAADRARGALLDVEGYERRRTATPSPAAASSGAPARLRDAQRGDDGRVRAPLPLLAPGCFWPACEGGDPTGECCMGLA
jgi:hypothetical protein